MFPDPRPPSLLPFVPSPGAHPTQPLNHTTDAHTHACTQAGLPDAVVDSVRNSVDALPLCSHSTQGGHGVDVLHHASPAGGAAFFMPTLS